MSNYEIRNDDDLKLWFRIKSIEKKIDKLGPIYSKGFDWVEWESLEEESAMYVSQLSIYKDVVKKIVSPNINSVHLINSLFCSIPP
tara:strand:+ start:123 stop:380 length:258 start_codon:yes stop_codon:yes gene_type:complete